MMALYGYANACALRIYTSQSSAFKGALRYLVKMTGDCGQLAVFVGPMMSIAAAAVSRPERIWPTLIYIDQKKLLIYINDRSHPYSSYAARCLIGRMSVEDNRQAGAA